MSTPAQWAALIALVSGLGITTGCGDDDGQQNNRNLNGNDNANHNSNHNSNQGPLPDFPLRPQAAHDLECDGGGSGSYLDNDFVCQVPIDATTLEIYVQATPTRCVSSGLSYTPVFDDVVVWYREDGQAWPTEGRYEWGSNHHMDYIQFLLHGDYYVVWRSSIGAGFRPCARPDCLLPCDPGTDFATCDNYSGYTVDGCDRVSGGPPPPLPVICVLLNADGTVPPLLDPWTTDPPVLPCSPDNAG